MKRSVPNSLFLVSFLVLRFTNQSSVTEALNRNEGEIWGKVILITLTFVLLALFVWMNKTHLYDFNIDKGFLILLILAGITLALFFVPVFLGVPLFLIVCVIGFGMKKQLFVYSDASLIPAGTFMLVSVMVAPLLFPILASVPRSLPKITFELFLHALANVSFLGVVFEELLFRGILWMFIRTFGISDGKIVFVQALFFWLAHFPLLGSGHQYSFFLSIPLASVILGLIVLRSKSLTTSTIIHMLYNLVVGLFQ
jgi:membrane protease YdiL (CAAX protease family)